MTRGKPTLYLSGSVRHTNWQQSVVEQLGDVYNILNPEVLQHSDNLPWIARVERRWLDKSDIVLGYIEPDNLAPVGAAAEIGYANGTGKQVILVTPEGRNITTWLRFFINGNIPFTRLEDAIAELRRLADDTAAVWPGRINLARENVEWMLRCTKALHDCASALGVEGFDAEHQRTTAVIAAIENALDNEGDSNGS